MKISKETESDLLKLGLYQIVGGVMGIAVILWALYKTDQYSVLLIALCAIVILFYCYSIYCGNLCLKPDHNALMHSFINQVLQAVGFIVGGFGFKYVAGLYFDICIYMTQGLSFDFGLGISKFLLNFNIDAGILQVYINVVAIGLVIWINSLEKKVKAEIELRTEIEIGNS